jgi:ArsR family transcriptional regulator
MDLLTWHKALADETRLRILYLLLHYELNVNELVSFMDMGQSRVSRHLKIMAESGLLSLRRDGLWSFYRAVENGAGKDFITALLPFMDGDDLLKKELRNLKSMMEKKAEEKVRFFNDIAGDWDSIKSAILGDLDVSRYVIPLLEPDDVAADLGCGTGLLMKEMCGKVARVIGVDKSPNMLDMARTRLQGPCGGEPDLRIGELEHLPMRDRELDFAVINMVLHYLRYPAQAIREAARSIREGGVLLIADLGKHADEDMRRRYGHQWLGFSSEEIRQWLKESGFAVESTESVKVKKNLTVNIFKARRLNRQIPVPIRPPQEKE